MGRGGLAAGGGAWVQICSGGAGCRKAQSASMPQRGGREGGAEGLKGDSGDWAEELADV